MPAHCRDYLRKFIWDGNSVFVRGSSRVHASMFATVANVVRNRFPGMFEHRTSGSLLILVLPIPVVPGVSVIRPPLQGPFYAPFIVNPSYAVEHAAKGTWARTDIPFLPRSARWDLHEQAVEF